MLLEVIAKNINDVLEINKSQANRIELCRELNVGGLTPDYNVIKECTEASNIPVNVIVRTSAENFFFNEKEIDEMLEQIKFISTTKANGIVIGVLNENYTINEEFLESVNKVRGSLEITFHKAFDELKDFEKGMEVLDKFKINNVLTSGGVDINNGFDALKKLVNKKYSTNILIGGGVTLDNLSSCLSISDNIHIGTAARTAKAWDGTEISIENIAKFKNV